MKQYKDMLGEQLKHLEKVLTTKEEKPMSTLGKEVIELDGVKYRVVKFVKLPIVYHFAVLIYEILAFFLYLKNYSHVKKLSKKI